MSRKRGEAPTIKSGGPLLIVITLLIVIYLIVLPPETRQELLGEAPVSGGSDLDTGTSNERNAVQEYPGAEFVFSGPGRIDTATRSEYTHRLASVHLTAREDAQVLFTENPFIVRSNIFEETSHSSTFSVSDPDLASNVLMTFNAEEHAGVLSITLNGHPIYSNDMASSQVDPIAISPELLMKVNRLEFQVSSIGWAFWQSHTYEIGDLRIQADILDTSRQSSMTTFTLRADEANAAHSIQLSYVPECDQREVHKVRAYVNGRLIFNQVPDCGIKNTHFIEQSYITAGPNTLEFMTEAGEVLLDTMRITTNIDEEANDVTYFFELDEDLFSFDIEEENVCGEYDGYCPDNCDEDLDRDCCFEEYTHAFWCDLPTENSDDRCVGSVTGSTIYRCRSGYEDEDGDVPDDFEGICGDDNDNTCPLGCSRFFDKDCCLEDGSNRYWCDEVPSTGLIDVCREDMPADACRLCPSGYEGEDEDPQCSYESRNPTEDEVVLKNDYEVITEFMFVDDDRNKEAEVIVNGYTTNFDTYKDTYDKDISDFVKDGSNYITVRPRSDFSLVEVRVDVGRK